MNTLITKNELENIKIAIANECPFDAGIGRIIVIQVTRDYVEEKTEGTPILAIEHNGLWIPSSAANKTGDIGKDNDVVKAVIKSIGPLKGMNAEVLCRTSPYMVNQIVYVFPNVFETMVTVRDVDYFFYSERDIVATMKDMKKTMTESGL